MSSFRFWLRASLLIVIACASSGCMHRLHLRPAAVVRDQARAALSCHDAIEVRRMSARYEQRAQADAAYEASGCGRSYYALCDAAGSRGSCTAVNRLPTQGVAPEAPHAIVQMIGMRSGWAPTGADSMWENIGVNAGYSSRLAALVDPAPLSFAVPPGAQSITLATGPSSVHQESRIRTWESSSYSTVGNTRYRETTTHFVPYLVDVRSDTAGCSAGLRFDAEAGHVYRVGYLTEAGQCAMLCFDVTGGGQADCRANSPAR